MTASAAGAELSIVRAGNGAPRPEAAGRRDSRAHGGYRRPRLLWPDEGGAARRLAPGPRGAVRADAARAVRVGPAALRGCARAAAAARTTRRPCGAAGAAATDPPRDSGGGGRDAGRLLGASGTDLDAAPHRHGRLPRHGPAARAACHRLRREAQAAAPAPAAGGACTRRGMTLGTHCCRTCACCRRSALARACAALAVALTLVLTRLPMCVCDAGACEDTTAAAAPRWVRAGGHPRSGARGTRRVLPAQVRPCPARPTHDRTTVRRHRL
eukprot:scaffold117166_cov66-Phaeocystis_antarctica.AAC.5